jgi:hypothetical protein
MKRCALHPKSSGADGPVRILERLRARIPEFQKVYLELIDEEPTRVMPNEMEKLVRELPRDTEIVTLFKRISDECMIARPDATIRIMRCANSSFSMDEKGFGVNISLDGMKKWATG